MTFELHERPEQGNGEREEALLRSKALGDLSNQLSALCAPAIAAKVLASIIDLGGIDGQEAFDILRWCLLVQSGEA